MAAFTKNKRLKFGHCPNWGGGGLGRMADVRTSLVGENGIAVLGEKSLYWKKKVFAGRKMYCAHNDPFHPENQ